MRKILFLSMACLMTLCAMAQEINAISATQGETTDWYQFGKNGRIDVTLYEQGNPVIGGKIFDLSKGNVETAFGIDPLPPIKETAKDELEDKKKDANDRMNKKAERYDQIAKVQQAKVQGNAKVTSAAATAGIYIDQATNESAIQTEKQNGLTAMEEETLKALASIQAAIADYKEGKKNYINDMAKDAKDTINALGVYYTVEDEAINKIDQAVATAEASINNADSEEQVNDAKNNALNKINQQLAYVQDYYNKLQAAIAEIKYVANGAKEEIDGLGVDENAKNNAKAEIDNIAHTAEQTINAATSKAAIDNAKTEAIAQIYNVVQNLKDMWVSVRTDGTAGNWNTICLERNITTIDGATFWTISGQDANSFILDQVTEPEAGQGYLIRFTATELKVKYGDQVAATPVLASYDNPVQGTFEQIDAAETNELVGNYVVYNNQLCMVESWVGMRDHRAYVVTVYVPNNAPAPAPNRARMYMPKPNNTPTDNPSLHHSVNSSFKMIKDGRLVIVRDGKMFNAQGQMLQ